MTIGPLGAVRFCDISIRTKMAAALGILVLMICVTGWFSADCIMRVHETAEDINSTWLPEIRYIGDIRYNMARHRAIIGRYLMASAPDQKSQIGDGVYLAEKNVEDLRKRYEPLIASAAERTAYDAFVLAWQAYLAACAKVLATSNSGDNAEAMKFFVTEVSTGGLKAESAMDRVVEINLAGGKATEQSGTGLYLSSRNVLMASVGFSILLTLVAGYFLTNAIARPIEAITMTMARLAGGDSDVFIPASGQRDEIGQMAGAVLVFKQQAIENIRQAEQIRAAELEAINFRTKAILDKAVSLLLDHKRRGNSVLSA